MINHLLTHNDYNSRKDGKYLKNIMLSELEWELIIDLLQVLGPIEEVTTYLGGSKYITHSLLYRLIQSLKKRFKPQRLLNNEELDFNSEDDIFDYGEFENQDIESNNIDLPVNTDNIVNQVKKNMYQALNHYFSTPSSEKFLSALLDPRCKRLDDIDYSIYLDVKNKLYELYKEKKILEDEKKEKEKQTQESAIEDEYSNTVVNLLYTPSLLKSLDDKEIVAQDEVEEYLDMPQIGINNDPLAWWKMHSIKFPILSELSKIYLAIPATSTSSERLFSDAGNLLTNKRTRMLPELFKRMIFLKKNINKFKSIHPTS
jgi:hypothetical protein